MMMPALRAAVMIWFSMAVVRFWKASVMKMMYLSPLRFLVTSIAPVTGSRNAPSKSVPPPVDDSPAIVLMMFAFVLVYGSNRRLSSSKFVTALAAGG